ncbi:SAM-dependent methyltransferase [Desulfonema ishimotonii]|uniref:SAM-dependent methyltransferase n=1 Tax=Desulfonema ishimotonii TaxID=45657 RepID=A0A401FR40_9BACT|nr:methyltransferase domain-containing protein [Desulfonema ishimotonii]GBC59432.1 SAM-dependent methyltransferase [Desulfonema ishimotonii]
MAYCRLYEQEAVRATVGPAIRPGGFALTDWAVKFCGFPKGARIADIGCGCGATVGHLRKMYQLEASGADMSALLLAEGRQASALPLIRASADALPYGNGVMDGLFCECVLSILPDPETALGEFYRVLKPGGCLVLSDIYLRQPPADNRLKELPVISCFTSAVSEDARIAQVRAAGFRILLWEDHTRLLKEMAAQFVFEHGSLQEFWAQMLPCGCAGETAAAIREAKPGYYLMVARKGAG